MAEASETRMVDGSSVNFGKLQSGRRQRLDWSTLFSHLLKSDFGMFWDVAGLFTLSPSYILSTASTLKNEFIVRDYLNDRLTQSWFAETCSCLVWYARSCVSFFWQLCRLKWIEAFSFVTDCVLLSSNANISLEQIWRAPINRILTELFIIDTNEEDKDTMHFMRILGIRVIVVFQEGNSPFRNSGN